jgi:thioredoxin reductase (NADPH)
MADARAVQIAIVGAGPAGLAAAVHAARERIPHCVFECAAPGGLLRAGCLVENMPGFADGLSGESLADRLVAHARGLGVRFESAAVVGARCVAAGFEIQCENGMRHAETLVLATGTRAVLPALEGAREAQANGLLHCDMRTMPRDLAGARVLVCGGGDAAFDAALNARARGAEVEIRMRGDVPRARTPLIERVRQAAIAVLTGVELVALSSENARLRVGFRSGGGNVVEEEARYLVACFGRTAETALWESFSGSSLAPPESVETPIPGLFLAGDMIHGRCRYAAVAAGDGTRAAWLAQQYLAGRARRDTERRPGAQSGSEEAGQIAGRRVS